MGVMAHCKVYGAILPCAAQKRLYRSRCRFGGRLGGPKEPRVRRGSQSSTGRGTYERFSPIENHCNSELCNNGWSLTFAQYTDGKLLLTAIYRCSSLGDRNLHVREISDLKLCFPTTTAKEGVAATRDCLSASASRFNQWKSISKNSTSRQ